jgi:tRNA A-37 threonylcarbamoyl transferase component Bud32
LIDDDLTRSVVSAGAPRDQFHPGHQLGTYRVVRLLGRGGMGKVYEAQHLDTHRRVALKILNHTLPTAADRARFLREGQLAASINHPNSVYIFATEEIAGTLAIVMELASGGTLKDVVQAQGPMPPAAAVDAILQVIDGLEAAAATGVLHRDVKPSNCFVGGDGTVKIGDFGLSIATRALDETHLTLAGTMLGTPAFASPEQIRGESLDVRSDLYSTGATLYYLLTGQPPFAGAGVQLVANVLGRDAGSPKLVKPDLPGVLAQVVQSCLAKDRSQRPDSYQSLRRDLLPFSSRALTPAAPGVRVMAAIIDLLLFELPVAFLGFLNVPGFQGLSPTRVTADFVLGLLYFGVLEGIWSASLGKMLFRIRIAGPGHRPAGIGRTVVRTWVYLSPSYVPVAILLTVPPLARRSAVTFAATQLIAFALLFSTARRGNGFAGLHDLASRTRVVRRLDAPVREPLSMPEHGVHVTPDARHIGPYAILETHDDPNSDHLLLAYDQVLRRRVWIQLMPAGSPDLTLARRDLARPGRLRWLTGKRTPVECWDAYDAPEGLPFVTIAPEERSWSAARFWLLDLVREVEAIVADHRDFALDAEHVWITQSSRAILLDFRCPGLPARASTAIGAPPRPQTPAQADAFIRRIATVALSRGAADSHGVLIPSAATAGPLPLHAHAFLVQLEQRLFPGLKAMAAALHETLGKRAVLTRDRRAVHLALCAAMPTCALMAGIASAVIRGAFTAGGIIAPLAFSLILTSSLAVWSAAWFRGGLMLRALDIAVVTGAGEEASRQRALLRAIVAWSPCLFFLFAILFGWTVLGTAALVLMVGGTVMAYLTPERGLQDRIVRTWLVPR